MIRLLTGIAIWLGIVSSAPAHVTSLSSGRVSVEGRAVSGEIRVNRHDLDMALGGAASGEAAAGYILAHIRVSAGGEPCAAEPHDTVEDQDVLTLRVTWRCPTALSRAYRATLFHELDPASRHILVLAGPAGERQALLDADTPESVLEAGASDASGVAWRYLVAGIEHIFLGYDHIAFLLAVVLWGRRFMPLLKVVTAFTAAHSVTLSLAALNLVQLPAAIVEPAIAASIVVVAVENFFVHDIRHRWKLTFLLGLVHGFGFAGALGELGLPRDARLVSLASFNMGVELGQTAILAIALPVLFLAERGLAKRAPIAARAGIVYALSLIIAALGLWWLIDRTLTA
jgi:hydrogenase/urease accessory protein HupE